MSETWACLLMHLLSCTTRQRPAAVCERLALASRRVPRLYEGMAHRQSWRGYAVFGHCGATHRDILVDSQTLCPIPTASPLHPHCIPTASRCVTPARP